MKFNVRVTTKALQEKVIKNSNSNFSVYLTKSPQKGQANKALIKLLAKHFHLSKSKVRIVQGHKSRFKIIEIKEE